jgi:PAS domain S-box-containing protein
MIEIVYVEDEPYLLDVASEYLGREQGFDIRLAQSVAAARLMLRDRRADVIISDYEMPGEDGLEFLNSLRKARDNTPFILFTGKGREAVIIDALNLGADFYVKKGTDIKEQFAELVHIIRRVHEQRVAEDKAARLGARFGAMLENTSELILIVSMQGDVEFVSPSVQTILGYDPAAAKGHRAQEMLHALGFEGLMAMVDRLLTTDGGSVSGRVDLEAADIDGRLHQLQGTWTAICDSAGPLMVFNWLDVTEKNDLDRKAAQSERALLAMLEIVPGGMSLMDRDGNFVALNEELISELGGIENDYIGRPFLEIVPPEYRDVAVMIHKDLVATKEHKSINIQVLGRQQYLHFFPVLNEDGEIDRICAFSIDITDSVAMVEKMVRVENLHRQVLDSMPIPMWEVATDLSEVWVNGASRGLLGIVGYYDGDVLRDHIHPEDIDNFAQSMDTAAAAGRPTTCTLRIKFADQQWHTITAATKRLVDAKGKDLGFVGAALQVE